jgi:hypothetical protein
MEKIIKNRIIKTDKVKWRDFKFIQKDNFKELTNESFDKLKYSIMNNNFLESFKVWENEGNIYCLDGFHRVKILNILESEGFLIPDSFNADFIDCHDKKDAAKLVTIYSSIYASVTQEGFYEFLNDYNLNFEDLKLEIDIPKIDLEKFNDSFIEDIKEKEIDENLETGKECPKCGYKW